MMRPIPIHHGFSTADAGEVELRFLGDQLSLSFIDWRGEHRQVLFHDVLAFRWQELDRTDVRDDSTYEIRDSIWQHQQAELSGASPEGLTHYLLCFNGQGSLDILARGLTHSTL